MQYNQATAATSMHSNHDSQNEQSHAAVTTTLNKKTSSVRHACWHVLLCAHSNPPLPGRGPTEFTLPVNSCMSTSLLRESCTQMVLLK